MISDMTKYRDYKKLNLCCGDNLLKNFLNVDVCEEADLKRDLSVFPWPWDNESIDEVYMCHALEHFPDQQVVILEMHRILKKGGKITLIVPHSSSVMAIGCMGHYRTYSYDTLNDYLTRPFYMFKKALFKTEFQELRWWYNRPTTNIPEWMYVFIYPMDFIINKLIKLSPRVFENLWCYYVGGAKEVEWRGVKI